MASRNRTLAISTALVGVAIAAAVVYRLNLPPDLIKEIPAELFTRQPELTVPYETYVKRGNEYIWGANDCSSFVMGYINSCGTVCPFRPTTAELMKPDFMSKVGFVRDTKKIKTGDILVFRYQNSKKEWRGHTGIVVWHLDRHYVMHNTESHNGVVLEALPHFLQKAKTLTNNGTDLLRTYRRKDFATWYTQFAEKRDRT